MSQNWTKRNLFYLAKMYTEKLWAGDAYECLKKCITISILDFVLTQDAECHSEYTLRDKSGREFSDLFEVHIIELRKPSAEAGAIGEWIQLFNAGSVEELEAVPEKLRKEILSQKASFQKVPSVYIWVT